MGLAAYCRTVIAMSCCFLKGNQKGKKPVCITIPSPGDSDTLQVLFTLKNVTVLEQFHNCSHDGMRVHVTPHFLPSAFHSSDFLCILHVFRDSSSPGYYFFGPSLNLSDFVSSCAPMILEEHFSPITRLCTRFIVFTCPILH